jgi:hypothetical protein
VVKFSNFLDKTRIVPTIEATSLAYDDKYDAFMIIANNLEKDLTKEALNTYLDDLLLLKKVEY